MNETRILIIDDERFLGSQLKAALATGSGAIYWAQAHDEALMAVRFFEPHAVLLNAASCESQAIGRAIASLRDAANGRPMRILVHGMPPGNDGGSGADRLLGRVREIPELVAAVSNLMPPSRKGDTGAVPVSAAAAAPPAVAPSAPAPPPPAPAQPDEPLVEDDLVLTTREVELPDADELERLTAQADTAAEDFDVLEADPLDLAPEAIVPAPPPKKEAAPTVEKPTFAGDMMETPFWKLLWRLKEESADGLLRVESREGDTDVWFERGQPVQVSGGGPNTTLGRVMVRTGLVSEDAYRSAMGELASSSAENERLGEVLLRNHAATPALIDQGLVVQAEEKLLELFALRRAPYSFFSGRSGANGPRLPQDVAAALLRGFERLPTSELGALLGDKRSQFPVVDAAALPPGFVATDPRLASLLPLLDGSRALERVLSSEAKPRAAAILALETAGGVLWRLNPTVKAAPAESPAATSAMRVDGRTRETSRAAVSQAMTQQDAAGAAERINALYLRVKGKSYYEVLELPPTAAADEVARRCERLRALVAPDKVDGLPAFGQEMARALEMRKLFRSMSTTLATPETRAEYDRSLAPVPETRRNAFRREDELMRAQELLEQEQWKEARELYQHVASLSQGEDADVLMGLGYTTYMNAPPAERSAVVREAFANVRRALDVRPNFGLAAYYAGEILRGEGRMDDARKFYTHAQQLEPENPKVLRALKLLGSPEPAPEAGTLALVASDILVEGGDAALEEGIKKLHGRAFGQAVQKQLSSWLGARGFDFTKDVVVTEARGKWIAACPLGSAPLGADGVTALLGFPGAFKRALEPHVAKLRQGAPDGLACRVRVAVVAGEGTVEGSGGTRRIAGGLPTQALMAVGKDNGAFSTDASSLKAMLHVASVEESGSHLEPLGLVLSEVRESAGSANPLYLVAPRKVSAAPSARKVAPRPERPVAQSIPQAELQVTFDLAEVLLGNMDVRLEGIFTAIAEASGSQEGGRLWDRLRRGGGKGPDIGKARLRTRLFEPILQGSKIFLGIADVQQWLRLIEGVGQHYTDALFKEGVSYQKADRNLWKGAKVDRAFADLERLSPSQIYAISEACRLFGGAWFTEDKYEDTTFSDLTSRASHRGRAVLADLGIGEPGLLPTQILDIFEGAIDTPDDAIEPVNFFEYFALLSLIGVTEGIRSFEIDHLSETHKTGTAKYEHALESIHESFDEYIGILRKGLGQYVRINRILNLRSPFAQAEETRSMFATKYNLPLYHHIEVRNA